MMYPMRTTLTLEPDVAEALEREARRQGKSTKSVVNQALRLGLGLVGKPPAPTPFTVEPHSFGVRPGVDLDRINQLVDELEAEEYASEPRS